MLPEFRRLTGEERSAANRVAARALRDDPLFVYLHGPDPIARQVATYGAFRTAPVHRGGWWRRRPEAEVLPAPEVWGAVVGGHVIGSAAAAQPGACFVDVLPEVARRAPLGPEGLPGSSDRLTRVLASLAEHHCEERHWHVGPVGVEPGLQGRGVGAAVMGLLCAAMDAEGEIAFLETETPQNVVFYRRLGFEVVGEAHLTGLDTWFMRRHPRIR